VKRDQSHTSERLRASADVQEILGRWVGLAGLEVREEAQQITGEIGSLGHCDEAVDLRGAV